ncbi:MAG: hypothetical protein CME12_05025 [Gemmatimonadetes bacterium]|nr:hypothetical protein [Gemmatimonadota bacterium]
MASQLARSSLNAPRKGFRRRDIFFRLAPWLGVLGLVAWTRWPVFPLFVFAGGAAVAALAARPRGGRARVLSSAIVLAGALAGSFAQFEMRGISRNFDAYWDSRSARAEEALDERLDDLTTMGEEAVRRIGNLASGGTGTSILEGLRDIREETGMTLATIYGSDGGFEVWDGVHRGVVPEELRTGEVRFLYQDRPLFSYLYFTAPIPGGGTAMAAALIKANLPRSLEEDPGDFLRDFRDGVGEDLRIFRADRPTDEEVYDWVWEGQALFSVAVVRPTQEQRLAEVRAVWSRVVGLLALIAWLVLAFTAGAERTDRVAAALTPMGLALLAPVGAAMGSASSFTAADFVLPGVPVTFERVLLVGVALSVVMAAHMPPALRLGSLTSALAVLIGFPLLSMLILVGAGPVLLAGAEGKWIIYQMGLAFLLTLVCIGAFRMGGRSNGGAPPQIPLTLAIVTLLGVCLAGAFWVLSIGSIPGWITGAWALPALLAAFGLSCVKKGARRDWMAWFAAAAIGSSAAVVIAWGARIDARMDEAEIQLSRLGVPVDPYLEYVLHRFADTADSLDAAGVESAELLYESWILSGLAEEGTGAWFTLWSAGDLPEFEITIGVDGRPGAADDFLEEARQGEPAFVRRLGFGDANYVVQVPLAYGRVLTGVLPARRELSNSSPFGPIFGSLTALSESPLTMVPVLEGDEATSEGTVWRRTAEGWEATVGVPYPDGAMDAKYVLDLPTSLLAAARGTLLVLGNALAILLLWALGQYVLVGRRLQVRTWRNPFSSFRSRVTVALFGFFLVSAALFGTLSFRTLNEVTERTAAAIAGRVAEDAAAFYRDVNGSMAALSVRVGADLLEYRAGELRGGSVDDLVELGLYDGLIPFELNQRIESREELLETTLGSLGGREHLMAFRRLPDGDVVATQVPLQAGATTLRQREILELIAFVVLIGAGLSLGLAFLVGRTLTRPMRTLQVASEKVGGGNLQLQLPGDRADEFGSVFTAFNRMVLRLQQARRDLVRTTRRTEAIVEDAATGVVALDALGRVILVNARAQAVLEGRIEVGERMPRFGGPRGEFVAWVEGCLRDHLREATVEFQLGERRIRVRAREVSRQEPGGIVLSLEDITDELRTERVLAWGEMARQVAHEVKNPLTPIKLSVQHIRRAWKDQKGEFETILDRNVGAILKEIDRLAEIASGFSRFGAPAAVGEVPLEPVDVGAVARELLTLYRGGEGGPIDFAADIPEDLPRISARETELKEVLSNLLENARAAIEGDGSVIIEAWSVPTAVEIRVRDDGTGIPVDLMGRIFEPQFSTRSTGTGLGLAIVRKLVESWGGMVTVEVDRGEGTVIRLQLRPWTEAERTDGEEPS